MPFLRINCAKCGKLAVSTKEFNINNKIICMLQCGHTISKKFLEEKKPESIISLDGKRLLPYQCEGVKFLERGNGTGGIFDEMRLGKTVQFLAFLNLHPENCPFIIICKSNLKSQMQREVMRWMGEDAIAQIIHNSKDVWLKGMTGYIISYDLLRRVSGGMKKSGNYVDQFSYNEIAQQMVKNAKENKLLTQIERLGIKTIIIDECQQIKNSSSARSVEIKEICKSIPNKIALSGMPIKNHAGEFYTVLNILSPQTFPTEAGYIRNDCYSVGTRYALRNEDNFRYKTRNIILRRTRDEVMPEMPKIMRTFMFSDLNASVQKAYDRELEEFLKDHQAGASQVSLLAYMARMRRLVGISKINPTVEYTKEFLESTDRNLVIFTHHLDVMGNLFLELKQAMEILNLSPPLKLQSDTQNKQEVVDAFQNKLSRIMIASTLSAGEGTTLNKCGDFVMMERQWNPANEEQAESRFPHVESEFQSINGTYMVAVGTIDEYLATMVEQKRQNVKSTLDGESNAADWNESSIMQELAGVLAATGSKKWTL